MPAHFFEAFQAASPRPTKPRSTGRTMVIDWGLGLNAQEDLLETAADFFDLAKVAVGISGLLRADLLSKKINRYRQQGVEPFPGGQYFEFAEVDRKADAYLPAVVEAGYAWVEVSDNLAAVSLAWKEKMIRRAVDEFQLRVVGEVGKKEGLASEDSLADDAKRCLDAGSSIILLEAAELVSEDQQIVDEVVDAIGIEAVMFELPGPWIDGVHQCDIHRMRRLLIQRFGAEVNIGNCDPGEIVALEAYRRGMGVNAGAAAGDET